MSRTAEVPNALLLLMRKSRATVLRFVKRKEVTVPHCAETAGTEVHCRVPLLCMLDLQSGAGPLLPLGREPIIGHP